MLRPGPDLDPHVRKQWPATPRDYCRKRYPHRRNLQRFIKQSTERALPGEAAAAEQHSASGDNFHGGQTAIGSSPIRGRTTIEISLETAHTFETNLPLAGTDPSAGIFASLCKKLVQDHSCDTTCATRQACNAVGSHPETSPECHLPLTRKPLLLSGSRHKLSAIFHATANRCRCMIRALA
jgi:hypothetical protein